MSCWPRMSTTSGRHAPRLREGARGADQAGAGAPRLLRLGDHRRGRGRADGRDRGLLPAAAATRTARVSGSVFKIERGAGGREDRVCSDVLRHRADTGPAAVRPRYRGEGDGRSACSTRGSGVRRARCRGRDREALGSCATIRVGDAIGAARGHGGTPLRTADDGDGRRPATPERQRRAAGRAGPARRAGSADQRAAGRRSPGDRPSRSTARCRRRSIQATLANDFGIDVTFRETTTICIERPIGAARRSRSSTPSRTRSWPPSGCASTRRRPARHRVPPGGRHSNRAAVRLQERGQLRGHDGRSTSGAALREGLFGWQVTDCIGDDDRCGYSSATARRHPRAAEHRRGLPEAHADGRSCGRSSGPGRGSASPSSEPVSTSRPATQSSLCQRWLDLVPLQRPRHCAESSPPSRSNSPPRACSASFDTCLG